MGASTRTPLPPVLEPIPTTAAAQRSYAEANSFSSDQGTGLAWNVDPLPNQACLKLHGLVELSCLPVSSPDARGQGSPFFWSEFHT